MCILCIILHMQTGFDIMEYDSSLRRLWGKRIAADFIDFVITFIIAFAFTFFFPMNPIFLLFVAQGIVWYLYSVIFDLAWGKTPGKFIFGIKAVAFIGDLTPLQAFVRNLTKLNWIIYISDIIAGLSTEGDPRQRFSERVVNSLVIAEIREEKKIKSFKIEEKEELELP